MNEATHETNEKRRFRPPWIALAFAGALFIIFLVHTLQPALTGRHPVTDTIGMSLREARLVLEEAELVVQVTSLQSEPGEQWRVTDQTPVSGALAAGDTVRLEVSPPYVAMPAIEGLTVDDATARLEEAGVQVGELVSEFHDTVPEGRVIGVHDHAAQAMKGSRVRLAVSAGPRLLDDLSGMRRNELREYLDRHKLTLVSFRYEKSDRPPGLIIRTRPEPGTPLHEVRRDGMTIYVTSRTGGDSRGN